MAVALSLVAGSPVLAQTSAPRDRQREVERELDLTRASDTVVEAELGRLNGAVARQQAVLSDARRADEAAQVAVGAATRRLAEIDVRARQTKAELANRAVAAYVHPRSEGGLVLVSNAASIGEVAQRRALVSVVQGRTADLVGSLRAAREDQADATAALEGARRVAAARAEAEAAEAGRLESEARAQQAAHNELSVRIANLQAESAALAEEQAELEARILQRASASAAPASQSPTALPAPRSSGSGAGFIWPVSGVVTSEFGPRWGSFHSGIDIAAPGGTPIAAARGGTVISAGWLGDYGLLVVIDHGGGVTTAYAHQSAIAATEGEQVGQGDIIGYVGSTGRSTGDHVHFEVRVGAAAQNPRGYLG